MCLSPQRRAIFPPFLDLWTSKSGPYPSVFWHFDFEMCFSPQRRAIFRHRNFKKWSAPEVFCTFSLENVLLATAACDFSTSQLQKVVRTCSVLYILTSKCTSRYSGVQFLHIATSKSGPSVSFLTFWLWNVLLATAACNFSTAQLQKVVRTCSERHILIENVLLATAACNFSCLLSTATSAPAALPRLLFDPAHPQIIEKHSISRLP